MKNTSFVIFFLIVIICSFIPKYGHTQLTSSDSSLFLNTLFIENLYIDNVNFPGKWYQNKEIESMPELYQQIDSEYPFQNSQLFNAYQNVVFNSNLYYDSVLNKTIDTFNLVNQANLFYCQNPFVQLKFTLDSVSRELEVFLDSANKPYKIGTKAFVLITGTGNNEMSKLIVSSNDYHNTNCYVKNFLREFGDVYVTTSPNEDMQAIRFMGKKLARYYPTFPNFLLNYLNSKNHAMGINKLIEAIALVKYLKSLYNEVYILGLSTGGTEALWVSLLSNPTATIVSSGYSVLCDTDAASLTVNSQFYGNCLNYFTKDTLKKYFQVSPTRYLFTQAMNDSPICQAEIDGQHTPSFFSGLSNISFNYSYYNHSFPPCNIIDTFLNLSLLSTLNVKMEDELNFSYNNPIQDELVINIVNFEKGLQYALIDLQGQKRKVGKIYTEISKVSTNDLPNGLYFFQLKNNREKVITKKIIIYR